VIYPDGTLQDTFESVIVHDGSVRRLVGAGLFRSQPGALIANPSGTATVVFSVFARYRPDRATPVGSVDVWVPLTGLRFTSTQLDWFAAGPGLAKISGEGTFAGSPGYSFTLWAFDAQRDWTDDFRIDRIRLRIWETATGELVYDSACSVDSCASGSSDLVTDMSEVVGWIVIRPDWRW
jgi:hypothetical protein